MLTAESYPIPLARLGAPFGHKFVNIHAEAGYM
jgi:hypothetical protein